MIKQRTVNTFQGGIVQDANPLNAEQTTLRDCLNGTLISNDGDEMILQNDMGNARVFQIKLDSGYVPVGMCVHGGVTYIASYNPATNKGQVGSFPSPQETYFSQSWGKDTDMEAPCATLGSGKLEFVQQLFPTDTVIRPGDKFDIFVSDKNYFDPRLVSFTNNSKIECHKYPSGEDVIYSDSNNYKSKKVLDGQILCPKNKAVTLSICIADASGNLHDITHTLKRFEIEELKEDSNVSYDGTNIEIAFDSDSSLKSNTGTIFQKYPENSESDSIVDQYDFVPRNIYNHKISGNLFLVYKLNTIDSVDISAEFLKGPVTDKQQYLSLNDDNSIPEGDIEEGELDIVFDVTYRYNCPDGYYIEDRGNNETDDTTGTYVSLYGEKSNFNPNVVLNGIQGVQYISDNNKTDKTLVALPFNAKNSKLSNPVYNFDSNLYSSRQRYLLEKIDIQKKKHIKYDLIPSTIYGNLNFFKQTIEADLEKLNSGEVSIYQWKYFVEDSGVNINWGLQSYPFIGTRLTNVQLEFHNLSDPNDEPYKYQISERTSYHGNFQNYISFDKLKPRQVYCVGISYKLTNIIGGQQSTDQTFYAGFRILITTKLYNRMYIKQDILDFNNLTEIDYNTLHTFRPKSIHRVKDGADISIISSSGVPLVLGGESLDTLQVEKTKSVNTTKKVISTLDTSDTDLYPFDIRDISYTYGSLSLSSEDSKEIDGNLIIQGADEASAKRVEDTVRESIQEIESSISDEGIIKITGNLNSLFIGKTNISEITFSKALTQYFPKFKGDTEVDYVKEQHEKLFGYHGYEGLNYPYYIAYGINYRGLKGHLDHHGVKYIEVNRSNGDPNHTPSTMTDLHSHVYGPTWDYPEVYHVTDGHAQFNMVEFLSNPNFINIQKQRTFVFFHTEPYFDYCKLNVTGWISCDRNGEEWDDQRIIDTAWKDLLFWKENNQFYLVTKEDNITSFTPQEFCELMSNIYTNTSEEIVLQNVTIASSITNAYNLDYRVRLKYNSMITPNYSAYIADKQSLYAEVKNNLAKLGITLGHTTEIENLEKYVTFTFNKDAENSQIEFLINMEGMEDIQDIATMLANGIYNSPILLGADNQIYFKDLQNNPLILSKSYELANIEDKLGPCQFGSQDLTNKKIKPNIVIENGRIIPGTPGSVIAQLIHGGSKDQETSLNLYAQRTIQILR